MTGREITINITQDERVQEDKEGGRERGREHMDTYTFPLPSLSSYCSASFSGRMPMAELADAIVSTGRRTLMHAVEHVHKSPVWQPAQVRREGRGSGWGGRQEGGREGGK